MNACSIEGTKCSVVTPSATISRRRAAGSRCAPGGAMTRVAPVSSGQRNSQTETSKPNGVFCSTRSAGPSPYCACIQSSRLSSPAWLLPTPFGRPVEPEVKMQ